MKRHNTSRGAALAATAILVLAIMPQRMRAANGYVQHNLASDIPLLADNTDPNLVNPWGLALSPFWICNYGTGTWLLDTEDGLITIRSGTQNVIKVDNSGSGAVYKSIALTNNPDYVYAAN